MADINFTTARGRELLIFFERPRVKYELTRWWKNHAVFTPLFAYLSRWIHGDLLWLSGGRA